MATASAIPLIGLAGLVIFGAGVWTGRIVALRLVPPSSWRSVAGMAFVFAGMLALPFPSNGGSGTTQTEPAVVQQATAVVSPHASVVVARHNMVVGAALSFRNVELRAVPAEAVQPNAATDLLEVLGQSLIVPVAAGEQIVMNRLTAQWCPPPPVFVTVAVDAANARSAPSIDSSVVGQVDYGTKLQITGQSADWLKVQLPDRREAWVAAGWVTPCDQPL